MEENSFHVLMDQHAQPKRTMPLQSSWSIVLSAVMVEREQFACLFISLVFFEFGAHYTAGLCLKVLFPVMIYSHAELDIFNSRSLAILRVALCNG